MNNNINRVKMVFNIALFAICSLFIFYFCFYNKQFMVNLGGIAKGVIVEKDLNLKTSVVDREKAYNDNFHMKYSFLEVYGAYGKISDFRKLNDRYKLSNDMMHGPAPLLRKDTIEANAEKVVKLKKLLEENNIPFVFVRFPIVTVNENVKLPPSIDEMYDDQALLFKNYLINNGVEYYDFDYMAEKGDPINMFFATDHHWKPEFAFKAYSEIGRILTEQYGVEIDQQSLDINNYNIDIIPQCFLGSHGKRTGQIYSGLDDFAVIYPKFDTNFNVILAGQQASGNYETVLINRRILEVKDKYNANVFSTYAISGHRSEIDNLTTKSNANVFLITDSYSMPIISFMANGVKRLEQVDVRYVDEDYVLSERILEVKPDIVVMQYNTGNLAPSNVFNFN